MNAESSLKCEVCNCRLGPPPDLAEYYSSIQQQVYTDIELSARRETMGWETTQEQIEKDLPRTFGNHQTVVSTPDGIQSLCMPYAIRVIDCCRARSITADSAGSRV